MKTKTKILILLAAMALTFLEFNFITCSGCFCKLLKRARNGPCWRPPAVRARPTPWSRLRQALRNGSDRNSR